MRDDDLRARLARVDPWRPDGSEERARTSRAHELLEAIMATPVDTTTEELTGAERSGGRRWLIPAVAASAVGALAVGAALMTGGSEPAKPATEAKRLELTAPDGSQMASCMMFDEKFLADMSPAFGGTVTEVSADSVVIDVDRWYSPEDSDVTEVELSTGTAGSVALDGVEFEQGKRYLVTAAEGNVNGCGYTGPATPELEASFERAFGK